MLNVDQEKEFGTIQNSWCHKNIMNGLRPGTLALFFLFGMAFMGMLFFMAFPEILSPKTAKTLLVPTTSLAFGREPAPQTSPSQPPDEQPPVALELKKIVSTPKPSIEKPVELPLAPPQERFIEPEQVPIQSHETTPKISPQPMIASVTVHRASRGRQIFGHVSIAGPSPNEKALPLDPTCGNLHTQIPTTRFFVVGEDGSLADVVVRITAGLPDRRWPAVEKPLLVSMRNCVFEPYVAAIQTGQSIQFQNVDPVMHNIHRTPGPGSNYQEVNSAFFPNSPPHRLSFPHPQDFLRIRCDVHSWMFTYVTVVDHPFFAVTSRDGRFVLPDLPAGKFAITATHRKGGTLKTEVTIDDDWSQEVEFKFVVPANGAGPG